MPGSFISNADQPNYLILVKWWMGKAFEVLLKQRNR